MKTIRALYVFSVYILSLPLLALFAIGILGYACICCDHDIDYIKSLLNAFIEGIREGHKTVMGFVKYGRKGYVEGLAE